MSNKTGIFDITTDEAERIKAGDMDTRFAVYMRLLPRLRAYCYGVCRNSQHPEYVDDCLSAVFLDMQSYPYDRGQQVFCYEVARTCRFELYGRRGGVAYYSLDVPIDDEGEDTFAEVCGTVEPQYYDEEREHLNNVLSVIDNQPTLTERGSDFLLCRAYGVKPYKGAYRDGKRAIIDGTSF